MKAASTGDRGGWGHQPGSAPISADNTNANPNAMTIEGFHGALAPGMRLMGLDLGTKTIGVAISDVDRCVATALETIKRTKFRDDAARMAETNAPYGVAKKALFVMLDGYRREYGLQSAVAVPVNLFGPDDNFDPHSSHVIPALIRKCVEAMDRGDETIEVWGTGSASREFLYVDDAADGILTAAERLDDPEPVNLGTNFEITIRDLVELIARLTGFAPTREALDEKIRWDPSKPDGQPRRCLDVERAKEKMGWRAKIGFEEGLERTIEWFREHRHRTDDPAVRV